MKWLDDIQRKRTEKALQKNIKKVSNPFASSEGRYASIDTLREMGTPEAIKGLMHRFDFTAQQTMVDAEEKEYAVKAVLYFGERAVDPIKRYLSVCTYPSWPVKLLRELTSDEVVLESLLDLLDAEDTAFRRAAEEKTLEVLKHLEEFRDPRIVDKALAYLDHSSDDIRLAALKLLEANADDRVREALLDILDADEAPRVRVAAADVFARMEWRTHGRSRGLRDKLPEGFLMTKDGVIKRVGRT
ncbi:HEAT repeat domain-containing protein [Thermodesulfobacteriota bacterium]